MHIWIILCDKCTWLTSVMQQIKAKVTDRLRYKYRINTNLLFFFTEAPTVSKEPAKESLI